MFVRDCGLGDHVRQHHMVSFTPLCMFLKKLQNVRDCRQKLEILWYLWCNAMHTALISGPYYVQWYQTSTKSHREFGWRRILRSREEESFSSNIRIFRVPQLNSNGDNYIELIDWKKVFVSEPVFTTCTETDEIKKRSVKENSLIQSVERHIKLVTEASSSVCDPRNREGYILNKLVPHSIQNRSGSLWIDSSIRLGDWVGVGWDSIPPASRWWVLEYFTRKSIKFVSWNMLRADKIKYIVLFQHCPKSLKLER